MVNWVADEEIRLKTDRPRVVWTLPEERTNAEVAASVRAIIGVAPERVLKVQPKVFMLTFTNQAMAAKMLELNGTPIAETSTMFHVRPAVQHMTLDQVFSFLAHRLEGRDKADSYIRAQPQADKSRWRTPRQDPRHVRVADAFDYDEEEDDCEYEEDEVETRPRGRNRDWRRRNERSRSVSPVTDTRNRANSAPSRSQVRPPSPPLRKNGDANSDDGQRNKNRTWDTSEMTCFRCKCLGHVSTQCMINMNDPKNQLRAGWLDGKPPEVRVSSNAKGKGRGKGKGKGNENSPQTGGYQNKKGKGKGRGGNWSNNGGGRGKGSQPPPQAQTQGGGGGDNGTTCEGLGAPGLWGPGGEQQPWLRM